MKDFLKPIEYPELIPYIERAKRGTVILDSTAIISLSNEIPEKYHNSKHRGGEYPKDGYAILDYLSHHGYMILVPEVVSVESASMLADGTSVEECWKGERRNAVPKEEMDKRQAFITRIREGGNPNMAIVPVYGNHDAATYINRIYNKLEKDPDLLKQVHEWHELDALPEAERDNKAYEKCCDALHTMRTALYNQRKEHLGERAALETCNELLRSGHKIKTPIFVFTDDKGLQTTSEAKLPIIQVTNGCFTGTPEDRRENLPSVNVLSKKGFFWALGRTKILSELGLRLPEEARSGGNPLSQAINAIMENEESKDQKFFPFDHLLETHAEPGYSHGHYEDQALNFMQSLNGLQQEIKQEIRDANHGKFRDRSEAAWEEWANSSTPSSKARDIQAKSNASVKVSSTRKF